MFLIGNNSLMEIYKKYGIKSIKQVRSWILKYNSHEEIKHSGNGGVSIMTKVRKTTYNEIVESVNYCIENNNYAETAENVRKGVVNDEDTFSRR